MLPVTGRADAPDNPSDRTPLVPSRLKRPPLQIKAIIYLTTCAVITAKKQGTSALFGLKSGLGESSI